MGRTDGGFHFGETVEEVEEEKKRKWRTIKVNEEAYILSRRLSSLLGMRQYEVVFVSLLFLHLILRGDFDNARALIEKLKVRADRVRTILENAAKALDEILNE